MAKGHARPRKNGKWQLEVDLGSYVDLKTGKKKRKRKYKTITAKGQRDADKQLIQFVAEVTGDGYYEPEKMNFVDFVYNEWLPKHAEKELSHTTLSTHLRYLELRIVPAFQHFRLDQVEAKHIVSFLENLEEAGMRLDKKKNEKGELVNKKGKLSGSTIVYHYRILNSIFKYAAEKRKLIEENPVKEVDKPKFEYEEVEVYDLEKTQKLFDCLETELLHWQIAIKIAVLAGPRRSELFAIDLVKDIDEETRVLNIRNALTYSKEKGLQLDKIKKGSRRSKMRKIVLPESLMEPIKKLRLIRQKEMMAFNKKDRWGNGDHCFLLAHEDGKPYNPTSIQRWWERFIKRHDLEYINIHALRHTSATLLINEGVHAKTISERLGHADIQITMNTYGHALQQADEIATDKLDKAISKRKNMSAT